MKAHTANQRLSRDLKLLMRDAQDLVKATVGGANDTIGEVRGRLASVLESAKNTCGRVQDATVRYSKATDRVIREHPYKALGIALGIGMLTGALVARR